MTVAPGAAPLVVPNETLDQASELGHLSPGVLLQEVGSIGAGPQGAADVQWYAFTLDGPARVSFGLSRINPTSSFDGVLSLFNNDPYDFGDAYNPYGYRLVEQVDARGGAGVASFDRLLGQGTYDLAVSGDGNLDFSPILAGSGLPGSTGDFSLSLAAADAGLGSATGPQVLASDPAPGATLGASPLAIRVDLSGPLDPSTVVAGQTVQLLYSPDGQFAMDGRQVPLLSTNFSPVVEAPPAPGADAADLPRYQGLNELQLFPASPMAPGYYKVLLAGSAAGGSTALADPMGNPLGADAAHPRGRDASITFQVNGVDGIAGATGSDDTPGTAHQLGDVTGAGLVQAAGAIGVDPSNPFNQVDLYHFTVSGAGNHSLVAEVFAGRIGSPLDPGVSLYQLQPDGSLLFIAGDNNTGDPAAATDGFSTPLFTDSALYASLTAGDYYLAVADGVNTPSPYEGQPPGSFGVYDPNQPGSAQNNFFNTGPYVLNLFVRPAPDPPHVVTTSPEPGSILPQPPTHLVVTFDQPMNVSELAFRAFQSTWQDIVPGITIQAADGTVYYPRFESYDAATNQATFLMLDALPNGDYQLHLSGAAGLADLGGNPLAGNDASGDEVIRFSVDAPPRGTGGNPLAWTDQEPNDDIDHPQDLGILFPAELVAGVTISRQSQQDPGQAPQDTADVYRFQILQDRMYTVTLSGAGLPAGVALSLTDSAGQAVMVNSFNGGRLLVGDLAAGTYVLTVGGWNPSQAAGIAYKVSLVLDTQYDNAPPLVSGPAPAIAIQLSSVAPPTESSPPPIAPPPVIPPPTEPPSVTTTPVSDPPPIEGPPGSETSPVAGPVGATTSGTGSSSSTAAAAAFAIAAPGSLLGGPSAYGVTSTDVGALAASPMGGVVAPGGAQMSATVLAQSTAAVPQSSVTAGLIVLGTSLQVIEPGEEAAPGGEATPPASASAEAGDWPTLRDQFALIGERTLALLAGISDHTMTMAADAATSEVSMSPTPQLREGPAARSPSPTSATVVVGRPDHEEAPPDRQPARVIVLAVAGLALGAYARYRGFARPEGRRGQFPSLAGPMLWKRRPFRSIGVGRSQV